MKDGVRDDAGRQTRRRRVTVRSVAAVVCVVLAALLTVPAVVGFWGQRTLTDTERYVATVGPLAADPDVQDAVARSISSAFESNVDVARIVNDTFGPVIADKPKLQALVPILTGAVNSLVATAAEKVVQSEQFRNVWVQTNATLQQEAVRFIEGDTSALKLVDNQVVLDTAPLVAEVRQQLVAAGLSFVDGIPASGAERQIVLFTSDQLQQAKTIYGFGKPIATWLIGLAAVLYLAAVLLARRRPRMVLTVGLALMLTSFVIGFAVAYGQVTVTDTLAGTVFAAASRVFYSTLLAYLDDGWRTLFVLGVILAVGGYVAGSSRAGTAVRTYCRDGLERAGAALAAPLGSLGGAVTRWQNGFRWAATAFGFVVLLWGLQPTVARLWWCTTGVIALYAGIQILVGAHKAASGPRDPASNEERTGPDGTAEPAWAG